jgi:hypothetical protein
MRAATSRMPPPPLPRRRQIGAAQPEDGQQLVDVDPVVMVL